MKPQNQCPLALAARPGIRHHSTMGSTARSRLMVPQPQPHSKGSHQRSSLVGHATLPVPYAGQCLALLFPLRSALSHFHTDSSCPRPCHGPSSVDTSLGVATTPTVHSYGTSPRGPRGPCVPSAHAGLLWVAGQGPTGSCSSHLPTATAPSSCSQQGPDTTATSCAISSGISPCTSFPERQLTPSTATHTPHWLTAGKAERWENLLTHLMSRTV